MWYNFEDMHCLIPPCVIPIWPESQGDHLRMQECMYLLIISQQQMWWLESSSVAFLAYIAFPSGVCNFTINTAPVGKLHLVETRAHMWHTLWQACCNPWQTGFPWVSLQLHRMHPFMQLSLHSCSSCSSCSDSRLAETKTSNSNGVMRERRICKTKQARTSHSFMPAK